MNNLFYLNSNPEYLNKVAAAGIVNNVSTDETMAPLPEPIKKSGIINVVKDFKWTKTIRKETTSTIPVLRMQEYYITHPAFISNLSSIIATVPKVMKNLASAAFPQATEDLISTTKNLMGNIENSEFVQEGLINPAKKNADKGWDPVSLTKKFLRKNNFNSIAPGINPGPNSYMKAYENIYGVTKTNFTYFLPYFESNFKTLETGFGSVEMMDNPGKFFSKAASIADNITNGFGIDFAQKYKYPDSGPSQTITFILDNTYDSSFDASGVPTWQKNWELIFLLLYQNLPNKRNKLFFDPPVIYKSYIDGVFYYLYSYISKLNVELIGNRQPRDVSLLLKDNADNAPSLKSVKTLIPEAYRITIEIKSLLPETKNLFLNSFYGDVTTQISSPNSTPEIIRNNPFV